MKAHHFIMAKKKTSNEFEEFENELAGFLKEKTGILTRTIDEVDAVKSFTSTGSYALNFCFSGSLQKGFPNGRIVNLEGLSGYGKSLESTRMAYEHVKKGGIAYIIDIERAIVKDFLVSVCGRDEETYNKIKIVNQIHTIEELREFLNKIITFQESKKSDKEILIIVDSWSGLSSDHEVEIVEKNKDTKDMSKAVAARALLRSLNQKFEDTGITLVLVMHLTEKVGVMFGEKTTPTSHGSAALFYASVRFQLMATSEIKNKDGMVLGTRLTFKGKKNRFTYKGKTCTIDYYFAGQRRGLDPLSGLIELLQEWKIYNGAKEPTSTSKINYVRSWDKQEFEFAYGKFEQFVEEYGGEEKFIADMDRELQIKLEGNDDKGKLIQSLAEVEDDEKDELDMLTGV